MRVSNQLYFDRFIGQLGTLQSRQFKLQNEVGTGQRITNPHDDPAAVGRVMNMQDDLRSLGQFERNNNRALEISRVTFETMRETQQTLGRATEIAVSAGDLLSSEAFQTFAAEVDQLIEHTLDLANTQYQGDYLFGGVNTGNEPFTATRDPATGLMTDATYNGSGEGASIRLAENATLSPFSSEAENLQLRDTLLQLRDLRDALKSADTVAIKATLGDLTASEDAVLASMSGIGAKQMRMEVIERHNLDRKELLEGEISAETDSNLADAVTRLNQTQLAYQAAMQSGARILNLSILDYVR